MAANAEITDLTMVVPAYNEEERLPETLAELAAFFDEGPGDVELILVDDKAVLMKQLGRKCLTLHLQQALADIPTELAQWPLSLSAGGLELGYEFDSHEEQNHIPALLKRLDELGISVRDLNTRESSLEDIFVSLVSERQGEAA